MLPRGDVPVFEFNLKYFSDPGPPKRSGSGAMLDLHGEEGGSGG